MNYNLFNIDGAPYRICQMYQYQHGHSHLDVTIFPQKHSQEPHQYIVFTEVAYIEGPTSWVGAGFRQRNATESFRFARSLGWSGIQKGDYTLYEAQAERSRFAAQDSPVWLRRTSANAILEVLANLPFLPYKNHKIRILARSAQLYTNGDHATDVEGAM